MVNPFDRNFFKFFIGFVCIIAVSFLVVTIASQYESSPNGISATASQK
jgi:hypothetical protein